jgi:DNA-binding XRE family transcriptional regulator
MNQIEVLKHKVEARLPGCKGVIDRPLNPAGPWMLDVHYDNWLVTVEWRSHRRFGVSAAEGHTYGEGPDEILPSLAAAVDRIVSLFATRVATAPPKAVTLSGLRERCNLSQAQLAQRLRVSQARISALEKDPPRSRLMTLRKAIEALGAQVEVRAIWPNRQTIALDLSEAQRKRRPSSRSPKRVVSPSKISKSR